MSQTADDILAHLNEPDRIDLMEVELGGQVAAFAKTPVGQYLTGRAMRVITEGRDKLEKTPPENGQAQRDIQKELLAARLILVWIAEAIRNGEHAEQRFDDNQRGLIDG